MQKKINIVLIGAPNSGKGTVCENLCKKYNLFHLSTGQILRDNIDSNTPLGKIAKPHMLGIVPEEIVTKMVLEEIKKTSSFGGIVFDGYPRTISQALALDENVKIDVIILLDVDEKDQDKLIARALDRLICPNCKSTLSSDMLKDGKCPHCSSIPKRRDDATEENVKKRLDVYKKETFPLIGFYGNRLFKVDALKAKSQVAADVEKIIQNVLAGK